MQTNSRIYVAGHLGLVGSALVRALTERGYRNVVTRTHAELDLIDQAAVRTFFETERPEYVLLAAAKVGGILANDTYPAQFIRENLAIQTNTIHEAWRTGVKRLLFLGSACIYPKLAPQPLKEEYLLTGPLEPTNRPYAIAKIAGIEMCWSYNRQYRTRYLAAMPTNLYGPGDNFDLESAHVLPALIRKFHQAKMARAAEVVIWGTGRARREFLYCDDMARACVSLMTLPDGKYDGLLGSDESKTGRFEPPYVNIGSGADLTIAELADTVGSVVGFEGKLVFDPSKPDGTPRRLMDVTKLSQLGLKAETNLADGIRSTYNWYLGPGNAFLGAGDVSPAAQRGRSA